MRVGVPFLWLAHDPTIVRKPEELANGTKAPFSRSSHSSGLFFSTDSQAEDTISM